MAEPLNVLIVEDSEVDTMLVLDELHRGGFSPIWERVETAEQLRVALDHGNWDVIICDYRLPRFNASEALEIAKRIQEYIPFILVSGSIGEIFAVEMMKAGVHDYVMKDNLNRLPEAVRRELRDAQVRIEHKEANLALQHSQKILETLASNIPGIIYIFIQPYHGSVAFQYISLGCQELLELRPDQILENASFYFNQIHPDDRAGYSTAIKQSAHNLKPLSYEWRIITPSGKLKWVQVSARPEYLENGDVVWYGVLLDVSDRKQAQELIIHNALHDPLTELPNRTLLVERLELAISRAKRLESYFYAVLFLDLDRFKVINDSLGHLLGDQLLKSIAQKLKTHLRDIDLVARIGGDEFVILLEDISHIKVAIQITERILKDLQTPLVINDSEIVITASIGVVLGTKSYSQASDLLRNADIAMYRAKAQGRSSYKIFDIEMHIQAVNRLTLETDIRKAIEREEFIVYYQPIIHILSNQLNNQQLVGFEALVRWQHPTRGLLSPGEFIPIAEEIGIIVAIDRWVFYTACQQLATWKNKFSEQFSGQFSGQLELKMSINLSAQDLRQEDLIDNIDQTLSQTGLTGDFITMEITESMLIENTNQTIELLKQLKARKIQISIDDFGTGYSSLNYLHRLPADNLKIDRSFVSQMQSGNRNYQVVNTIITLSNQLGLAVVAEGIETSQQLQWLQQMGCEFGQGHLFSGALDDKSAEILAFKQWAID